MAVKNSYKVKRYKIKQIEGINGKLTFLRVHDVGTGYGAPPNFLDAEVIIRMNTNPNLALGFQLRNDTNSLTHQGMLDLLKEAFLRNRTVRVEYQRTGPSVGRIIRVILFKP